MHQDALSNLILVHFYWPIHHEMFISSRNVYYLYQIMQEKQVCFSDVGISVSCVKKSSLERRPINQVL